MISTAFRVTMLGLLVALILAPAVSAAPATGGAADVSGQQGADMPGSAFSEPPPNAVMLFNGKDLSNWHYRSGEPALYWPVENGVITVARGDIVSGEIFDDAFIHVEFMIPDMPQATGQGKGNSGIHVQGRYEIQLLDSYGINIPGKGDCGAIYAQHAPLVNACKPPLEWQSFDIIFRAPRVDESGTVIERGRMTILQNGIVIQNNAEVLGVNVGPANVNIGEPGPLMIQDHGAPLKFRNIWLVHLPPKGSDTYGPQ